MRQRQLLIVAALLLLLQASTLLDATHVVKRDPERHYYTLHFPQGHLDASVPQAASAIATTLGTRYEGQVGELKTYHLLSVPISHHGKRGLDDAVLADFEMHKQLQRRWSKRDDDAWQKVAIDKQVLKKRWKRQAPPVVENDGKELLEMAQGTMDIQDPGFTNQWHLINQQHIGNDLNVTGVWKQGIAGNGTIVALLDDGLEHKSVDLAANFYAPGSYDFNDHVDLPTPRLWDDSHGTRCAGQIAAVKNEACGIGIAYDAKVAGIRILSAEISDVDEATALNYKYQENHIYSCSWGPPDNGETMEAPKGILADAFVNGIENGRGGKGSVYVFATGNGALSGDNCNFDGYTNSIYTITVGALDHTNEHPSYSESCSAQLVVAYSSGAGQYIYTTDVGDNHCADRHGGTSAAAPNAAGVFALVLSVRPDLTWRDMQHLCVQTAVPVALHDKDWKRLPSGRLYNHKFGYGKLDAYAIVEAAKNFEHVNKQTWLELPIVMNKTAIPDSSNRKAAKPLQSTVTITEEMVKAAGLLRLEHVTATVSVEHQRRGNVVINLRSPHQVESQLATERTGDRSPNGFLDWKFMSVKHWDEDPIGNWTLFVYDVRNPESTGSLLNWTLTLFGEMDPLFEGEPQHAPSASHDTSEASESHALPEATSPAAPHVSEHVPSRPTRVKKPPTSTLNSDSAKATDTLATAPPASNEEDSVTPDGESTQPDAESQSTSRGASTIVYGVVGSVSILLVATGLFYVKRKGWRSPTPPSNQQKRRTGDQYEFDQLGQFEIGDDEDEETGGGGDQSPLLRTPHNNPQ